MKNTQHRKHLVSFRHLYFALALCGILIAALADSPAPARAAFKAPVATYEGRVDRLNCGGITGYALDHDAPNQTLNVDIYVDGVLVNTVSAHRFRRDLYDRGMPNPYHGFLAPMPVDDEEIHTISVKFGGTTIDLQGGGSKQVACDASLFENEIPETTADGQGSTWEQGIEFSSSMSGIITSVRFWRAVGEPKGSHTARIWNTSGTELTSATFRETDAPGWQYAPVNFPVTAGVRYRVTYNIHKVVAKTFNVLNSPITVGPLTAWRSYYGSPARNFPTSSSTSNLFVDMAFNSPQ